MMMEPEIDTDGRTVWVNAPLCIGRFGVGGIDIHTVAADGCLYCTHAETTLDDWHTFQIEMQALHGVTVPDRYKPTRLR